MMYAAPGKVLPLASQEVSDSFEPENRIGRKSARGTGHSTSAVWNRMPASAVQARNCTIQCPMPTIAIGESLSRAETAFSIFRPAVECASYRSRMPTTS
jgi:hypothetical protein